MPIHLPLLSPLTANLAEVLFASLWQGTLLVLLVALGLRLLPGLPAAARAAIWAAVLVLVLALILVPILGHPPLASAARSSASGHTLHVPFGLSVGLVTLWVVASLFRLSQLAVGAVQLWIILREAQPLASTPAITALLRAASRRPQLCVSAKVHRPSVAGFLRPRLLLPADLLVSLNEAELTQIVLHELEHLRRGDDWVNLLQQLALVVLPLHPALPWLNRRLALERELACDDAVLATTGARKAYAACLAHVAERSLLRRGLSLALSVLGSQRRAALDNQRRGALGNRRHGAELTARVERILRRPERTFKGNRLRLATGLLLAGTTAMAGLLAHGPEFVSFGPADVSTGAVVVGSRSNSLQDRGRLPLLATLLNTAPDASQGNMKGNMGHAMLLRAVMPAPLRLSGARFVPRNAVVHVTLRHRARQISAPFSTPRVLLTDRQRPALGGATALELRRVPALFTRRLGPVLVETQQVWYAAVPFRDGWLVVQL